MPREQMLAVAHFCTVLSFSFLSVVLIIPLKKGYHWAAEGAALVNQLEEWKMCS